MITDTLDGYQKTEIGLIPSDWDVVELGELVTDFFSGGTPSTKKSEYWDGDIPWTTSAYIGENLYFDEAPKTVTSLGLEGSSSKLVPAGNLLIGTRVRVGKIAISSIDVAISQDLTAAIIDDTRVNLEFLTYAIRSNPVQALIQSRTRGSTIKGIARKDLFQIPVPLPPLSEQQHIARALKTIQREIEVQDQLIAGAQELKRSLMRHLFTYGPVPIHQTHQVELQDTEIGPVPAHWKLVKLEHLIDSGPQNGLYKPASEYGEGTPILRIDAFSAGDTIGPQRLKRVRLSDDEVSKYSLASGDIVINRVNGSVEILGKCALVGALVEPTVFESNMIRFAVDTEHILNQFVLHFLVSPQAREQIRTKARVVHQASINQQDLKSILVPLPDLSEQTAVVHTLGAVDRKIEIEESRRAALEALFNSMLHQLMTGQLRVPDPTASEKTHA